MRETPVEHRHSTGLLIALLLLMLLRCGTMFYGFDRLPYLSTSDEAAQNDPAVFLSRGEGLFGRSYAGILGSEPYRSHHMPLYTLTQATVFRLFGFSALTLRGPGILASLAACAIVLALLFRLFRNGNLTRWSVLVAGLIATLEPTALVVARQARNDSLTGFFGALACWFAFPPSGGTSNPSRRLMASALCLGLAISTHPEGVLYGIVLAASLWAFPFEGGPIEVFVAAALAACTPCLIWLATYRGDSLTALRQMVFWATRSAPMPDLVPDAFRALSHGDASRFISLGGFLFVLLLIPACALGLTLWTQRGNLRPPALRLPLTMAVACLGVAAALILLLGTRPTRLIAVFPVAVLGLAVSLSAATGVLRKLLPVAASAILLFEAAAGGAVILKVRSEYALRDPDRFASVIASIPASATVAADAQLWYAFLKAGRRIRVIDSELDLDNLYWNTGPGAFGKYRFIILDESDMDGYKFIPRGAVRRFHAGTNSFLVIDRTSPRIP